MVKVLLHRLLKVPLHDLRLTYISSKVRDGCCCHGDPPCIQYYVDVGVTCDSAHMLTLGWCVCRFQEGSSTWTEI